MTAPLGLLSRARIVLAAAALLGLSGCSGDDSATSDTDTDSDTAGTSGTAGTTGTTAGTTGTTASSATATTTAGTTSETTTAGTTTSGAVDYQSDIQPIWDAKCVTGCHVAGGSKADIPLGDGVSYDQLVDAQSVQLPSFKIVEPGDADKSYLWHKLNGSQGDVGGSGLSMPFGTMLDGASLQMIETWINDGAKP